MSILHGINNALFCIDKILSLVANQIITAKNRWYQTNWEN